MRLFNSASSKCIMSFLLDASSLRWLLRFSLLERLKSTVHHDWTVLPGNFAVSDMLAGLFDSPPHYALRLSGFSSCELAHLRCDIECADLPMASNSRQITGRMRQLHSMQKSQSTTASEERVVGLDPGSRPLDRFMDLLPCIPNKGITHATTHTCAAHAG